MLSPLPPLSGLVGEKRGGATTLNFELPTPIVEAIKRPKMFVKLNLFILRGLSSKHSLALYETLKDYEGIKKIRIPIDGLKKILGLKPEQYKIFTMFRERVIDVAVREINKKTDLKVSYELERMGRKVVAVLFKVKGDHQAFRFCQRPR